MSAGYSRISTLGEDGRYHFDAASRRVLESDTQVYTAKITVATFGETFLREREYGPRAIGGERARMVQFTWGGYVGGHYVGTDRFGGPMEYLKKLTAGTKP